MNKDTGESQRESHEDSRWDMSEVEPFHQESDRGDNTENLEKDPSIKQQEKEEALKEARERVKDVYPKMASIENTPDTKVLSSRPQIIHRKVTAGQVLKRTAVGTGSTALLVASASAMIFAPPSIPLALPVALCAADSVIYNIRGVNGSMFRVNPGNRIMQRINPFPVLLRHRGESSSEIFKDETKRLFEGLKPGETYTTRSHSMTYALLRNAQKEGLITDLNRENTGKKSRLFLENIVTGNWKAIKSGKKHDIYNIQFKVV